MSTNPWIALYSHVIHQARDGGRFACIPERDAVCIKKKRETEKGLLLRSPEDPKISTRERRLRQTCICRYRVRTSCKQVVALTSCCKMVGSSDSC